MNHTLKIHPQYYARVADGSKTFEVRENDRGFQSGDTITLQEWDPTTLNEQSPTPKGYTGSPDLRFKIGYIYVLSGTTIIFSLLPIDKAP